jgi:6,7-dimethyl-8-ribityllumazine synthase
MAVIVARFNAHVTSKLYDGCRDEFEARGLDLDTLTSIEVPGCFELPIAAKTLAASGKYDAVVCLGAVIRGDTPHFDYVSSETASGLQRAALDTGVPVIFGVLTTDNEEQAIERIGGSGGHKGREAALTAIEMVHTMVGLRGE